MKTISAGGLALSSLILGTDYFGTRLSEAESFSLIEGYYAGGGRTLDTARMYANWLPNGDGASERTLGAFFASSGLRKEFTLITKGGSSEKGTGGAGRVHEAELRLDMSESLEHLGCAPDLYLLHRDNPAVEVAEIMETLADFVRRGYTRAIGCSNWRAERIRAANAYAAAHGLPRFVADELQWSLAYSDPVMQNDLSLVCMNREQYDFHAGEGMAALAFSSQAKGFFAREASGEPQNEKALGRFDCPMNRERLARVQTLAARRGLSVSAVVLAYITSAPFPAAALIGCKSLPQLADSLTAADVTLQPEERAFLEGDARWPDADHAASL